MGDHFIIRALYNVYNRRASKRKHLVGPCNVPGGKRGVVLASGKRRAMLSANREPMRKQEPCSSSRPRGGYRDTLDREQRSSSSFTGSSESCWEKFFFFKG